MKLLKKVKHLDFIIQDEFELDEIIRKYGQTGDQIEEYISGLKNENKVQIKRKFELVDNLGTESTSKEEYEANITDSLFRKYEMNGEIFYSKDNYEVSEITEDEYWKEYDSNEYHVFTDLNYEEFLNDFDFESFDSFFENFVVNDCFLESFGSLKKLISKERRIKAEMCLIDFIRLIIESNNFLEEFKNHDNSNHIQKKICNYFIYYNSLLINSIKVDYNLIFPKIINGIGQLKEEIKIKAISKVLETVFLASCKLQENKTYYEDQDENKRNKQILDLISMKYNTKDQSQLGRSSTGKKPGSVDGIIIDKEKFEYIFEGFNLSSINKTYINEHLNKLEEAYDFKGLPIKFALVYCNIPNGTFEKFSTKYKEYIDDEYQSKYKKNGKTIEDVILPNYAESKVFKSLYLREDKEVCVYHILLKFESKKQYV